MTTSTCTLIDSIEFIDNDTVMVVCVDEKAATKALKRNPRAKVVRDETSEDERVALLYRIEDTNLLGAIRRA